MKQAILGTVASLGALGLVAASCAGDPDLFGGGSGIVTGSGTTASGTTASGTTTSGTTTSGTTTTGGGAGTGGTGPAGGSGGGSAVGGASTGGSGGTGPTCPHDPCLIGPALHPGCSDCVADVCDAQASCCGGANAFWGYRCVDLAAELCSLDCAANKESCDEQYGNTISYYLCDEGAATCRFGFSNLITSCATVCSTFGGTCLAAYDNVNQTYCQLDQWLTCDSTGEQYNVCVCSRGCGNGPPCGLGESCVNGVCQ